MSGYGLGQPTYTDMKGWMVIDPLTTPYSGVTSASPSDAKRSLQQLVAHVADGKLQDDVVCKLSVPMMGGASGTHEIELQVSDIMVMLAVAMNRFELYELVTDMQVRVRRNDLNQQMFTDGLLKLHRQLDDTFIPSNNAQPIVAELTRSGLIP